MAESNKVVIAYNMAPRLLEGLEADFPAVRFTVCADRAELPAALADAEVLVGGRLTPELLERAPALRWYHATGAGVDAILVPDLIESDIIITNGSGASASNMAEHLLGMMLAFARDFPSLLRAQVERRWLHDVHLFELGGQTLGVVGLGDIGGELAWRANALGMRVLGLRRRAGATPSVVERVYPPEGLHELLAASDHVAVCLPLTARTRGLIGADEFKAMKPTAYIYNVGRGPIVDHAALIAALEAGEIAGAGLDVTDPEPLPEDSPLWGMRNVFITCHTSGRSPNNNERSINIFRANLSRYRAGEPLVNVVDKREGY